MNTLIYQLENEADVKTYVQDTAHLCVESTFHTHQAGCKRNISPSSTKIIYFDNRAIRVESGCP